MKEWIFDLSQDFIPSRLITACILNCIGIYLIVNFNARLHSLVHYEAYVTSRAWFYFIFNTRAYARVRLLLFNFTARIMRDCNMRREMDLHKHFRSENQTMIRVFYKCRKIYRSKNMEISVSPSSACDPQEF